MIELTREQVDQVSGGHEGSWISGYEGAGAIMAVLGIGAMCMALSPFTLTFGIASATGLATAQFLADAGS